MSHWIWVAQETFSHIVINEEHIVLECIALILFEDCTFGTCVIDTTVTLRQPQDSVSDLIVLSFFAMKLWSKFLDQLKQRSGPNTQGWGQKRS